MTIHSSILAWKIPWTKESGRLQFIGSQRVGYDWSDLAHMTFRKEVTASCREGKKKKGSIWTNQPCILFSQTGAETTHDTMDTPYKAHRKIREQWVTLMAMLWCTVLSHVQLFATLWTVVHQAPLSMWFSRQEQFAL